MTTNRHEMAADHAFGARDTEAVYRLAAQGTRLGRQVRHALDVIEGALEQYRCVLLPVLSLIRCLSSRTAWSTPP
jgi:hypothetical protein